MKSLRIFVLVPIAALVFAVTAHAAPIQSVDSSRASEAYQKVDAFLSQGVVAQQLQKLGMNRQQVQARLAQLNQSQLEQLAAQVNMLNAGGTIQSGHVNPLGPFGYIFHQIGVMIGNVYRFLFSWTELH